MIISYFLSSLLVSSSITTARVVEYNWEVSYRTLSPNGIPKRMAVVNGQFPGPTMRASVGDTVRVNLHNNLGDNGTSIHFHGINQLGTPWSDGTPQINQCPIPSGSNYTYLFTPDQPGTSFWHSHFGPQYPLGVVGPTIIDNPNDPHKWDEEVLIIVTDHYNISEWTLTAVDRTPSPVGFEGIPPRPPPPDSVLMCKGSGGCNFFDGSPNVFDFSPGKTYRLRIVNMSAFVGFHFSIDQHPLRLIGADLVPLDGRSTVEILPIWPAQRYDVLVETKPNFAESVWIRSVAQNACYPIQNPNLKLETKAIIRFNSNLTNQPISTAFPDPFSNDCRDIDLSKLNPLESQDAIGEPSQILNLGVGLIVNTTAREIFGVVNGSSFDTKDVQQTPTLFEIHDGASVSQLASSRNAYQLNNGTVRIILNTTVGPGAHPYHLHGHSFQILGYLNGTYNEHKHELNLVNPPRRDTAMVPVNATAVFQFQTNNPGIQFFHCHMDWHLQEGLSLQLVELPESIRNLSIPLAARHLCKKHSP